MYQALIDPAAEDSGEAGFWDVLNTAVNVAGGVLGGAGNLQDHRQSAAPAQETNGTPLPASNTNPFNNQYVMWGALALFALIILMVLIKVF
ncbi:hypothetical protein AHAT_19050 [Agarivorans sp. Toyoura001]|uniref:hypothetical protein n=1 Tax=Agarivorans sp. Toyoura001 TaxID=2283141 RepID=UPI0010F243B5|nr:hypothetical protein [Agarivorans sp. Toyoura001]GDY26015.1 hypothetical protein AHAT_19050 [Agarivorans sp. Toyoura001]